MSAADDMEMSGVESLHYKRNVAEYSEVHQVKSAFSRVEGLSGYDQKIRHCFNYVNDEYRKFLKETSA